MSNLICQTATVPDPSCPGLPCQAVGSVTGFQVSNGQARSPFIVPHDGTTYRVTTSTADGGTDVRVPNAPDAARTITVHTADGGIRVDYTGTG